MRVLVIGSGGREHALCWRLAADGGVEVLAAPGSAGMVAVARPVEVDPLDLEAVTRLARDERVDLVVVGPEAPLVAGLVDRLVEEGVTVFGPTAAAARLEGSKAFAKAFMARHGIPTARFAVCEDLAAARSRLAADFPGRVVVKADGLAGGKGVVVAAGRAEAEAALDDLMGRRTLGAAGERVVLEEFLQGEEVSVMALTDGRTVRPLVPAQDHKAAWDGDRGPNTGGMGVVSDDRLLPPALYRQVSQEVLEPVVRGMAEEGTPFAGLLYAGLMLTADGPKVLEFNARFGDPETQAVLPRWRGSFAGALWAAARGELAAVELEWDPRPTACVVLAAAGYPGPPSRGARVHGLEMAAEMPRVAVFHAGTARSGDQFVTSGGRVLGVTALGADLGEAILRAYEAVACIRFEGMHYRRDIGERALRVLG